MSTESTPPAFAALHRARRIKPALLGGVCALALTVALALMVSPAAAKVKLKSKSRLGRDKEAARINKEPFGNIPKGPLQIFVSIDQQKLHLYSDGTLVADTSVATGVPSLPTPLGIFSVIQKDRYHHSNIYSNAPMPYMQRITWSGVALHEGESIGHRASHGCIRMPHEFAARLWLLTRLGVRVVVARKELSPVVIADAHLFVHKEMAPAPPVAAAAPVRTALSSDSSKSTDAAAAAPAALDPPPPPKPTASTASGADAVMAVAVKPDPDPAATPAAAAVPATDNVAASAPALSDPIAANAAPAAPAVADAAMPSATTAPASAPDGSPAAGQINQLRGSEAAAATSDVDTDESMPLPLPKPASLVAAAAERHAPIAIFISRKTKRIYVRQNFAPLFDAPVTIENVDQPLGTFVFTAIDSLEGGTFRWNVVSMPGDAPKAVRIVKRQRLANGRFRVREEVVERPVADQPPPETPEQALARIDIPQDVTDQISQLMVAGSSLIVSDQGLGGETGEGTDFIVITH